jgi:DNA (cytosine-5)-methyltransferase 1
VPTLNAFDNGDVRATTIIFYGNRVSDIRIQDDKINTLQARMGTGGNNMPLVAQAYDEYNDSVADTHHTLRAGTKQSTGVIENSIVRRLTPLECERLQGFPDGWTEGQPDTHRYKQMGNAVAVPVVEWIVQGICDTFDIAG